MSILTDTSVVPFRAATIGNLHPCAYLEAIGQNFIGSIRLRYYCIGLAKYRCSTAKGKLTSKKVVGLGRFELPTYGLGIQRAVLIGAGNSRLAMGSTSRRSIALTSPRYFRASFLRELVSS